MTTPPRRLTRDQFREGVLARDGHRCVLCGRGLAQGVKLDAHHIIERRLWPDGGYLLENGATLCDPDCHMKAEQTLVSCAELRAKCGITVTRLPPHLYGDTVYDKWGNVVLADGTRAPGELMGEASVRRVMEPVLHLFTAHYKPPRTYHLPWSAGRTRDDLGLTEEAVAAWRGRRVVVTLKLDGSNTSIYAGGYLHGRHVEAYDVPGADRIKALAAELGAELPPGYRVAGENIVRAHTVPYRHLRPHPRWFFPVFAVWDEDRCLSWEETVEWAELLNLPVPPVLYEGPWDPEVIRALARPEFEGDPMEGYVVRPASDFYLREYRSDVGKYVRGGFHTPATHNWRFETPIYNGTRAP